MDSGAALGYCCIAVNYSDDDRKSAEPCSGQLSYRKFQRKLYADTIDNTDGESLS